MFNKFSDEALRVISLAKKEMLELKHQYLGTEHLLLAMLKVDNKVSKYLNSEGIDYDLFKNKIIDILGVGKQEEELILYTPVVKEIFERAIELSEDNNNIVSIDNLFIGLIEIGDSIAFRTLKSLSLDINTIYDEFSFNGPKKNENKHSILDEIGIDLVSKALNNKFDPVIGREKEIHDIISILTRKNKSNPLLIGDAGVGKSAIIEEISRLISINEVPSKLKNKKIINVDMSALVAGTKYRGEFEEKINKIIKIAEENDDIILFIDEIHTIVGAGGAEGAIDASNIFKPALARGNIKLIGATTILEYKKFIEKDRALDRRFKKVFINEPNNVKDIIYKLKPIYENYHNVSISDELLDLIITLTDKNIHDYKNPDKTIDILDEVCAIAALKGNSNIDRYNILSNELNDIMNDKKEMILNNNFKEAYKLKQKENIILDKLNRLELIISTKKINRVTKKDIYDLFERKSNYINNITNKNKLINMITKDVLGQELPINKFIDAYFESINNDKINSILLTGPSGVGKSLFINSLVSYSKMHLIKLDMNEYSDSTSITKLIGSNPGYIGYDNDNYVLNEIRDYPYSILLLDNIDKAHINVINLIKQIINNNFIKDNKGNNIYFNNVLLVMTATINTRNTLGFGIRKVDSKVDEYIDNSLISIIDYQIKFNNLDRKNVVDIIKKYSKNELKHKEIEEILKKINYGEKGVKMVENMIKKYENDKKIKKNIKNYSKN